MTRPRRGDDAGTSLILVLIVVTVVAGGLAVLLSFTDTSFRTAVALRDVATRTYDADGALQAAVNNIRNSTYNASPGQKCFGGTDSLALPSFAGADSAVVTCAPDPARVLIQCPSLAQCNRPGNAILTLGRIAGEDGLNIQQPTGSTFRVHGNVFSNSTMNVVNGTLSTNARAYARGACTGTIVSTPAKACNYGSTPNVLGDDPGYAPATSTVPVYRPLPACTNAGSVVTFEPGYYDDAVGLTDMMDGNSPCRNSTWWFKPGAYYFDFHNGQNPLLPAKADKSDLVWTIDDGTLVAGTPVNASGVAIAQPAVPAAIPGSCDNPIDNARAVGVQFIFGGESQLAVKSGQVEICGTYSVTKPPVAVYGLSTGTATPTVLTGLVPSTVTAAGPYVNATPASLSNVDGTNVATWTANRNRDTATLTVNGYAPPSAIPAGSVLTSAVVRVVHRHSDAANLNPITVTLTPNGTTSTVSGTHGGYTGGSAWRTSSVTLDAVGTGALARAIYAGTFTGARIAVSTELTRNNDVEQVDAIRLDLTYQAPAFRKLDGCVTATPYTGVGGNGCAVVSTLNNNGNEFYVQGTTYVPTGAVDLTLNNAAEQVFRFGVVARSLWVKLTGSFGYSGVVIEVPDDSPGFVFSVYLTAYVCPAANSCAAGGTPVLRAKVAFVDGDPTAPDPGRRQVTILSWSTPG